MPISANRPIKEGRSQPVKEHEVAHRFAANSAKLGPEHFLRHQIVLAPVPSRRHLSAGAKSAARLVSFNKADVAAAFDARNFYLRQIFSGCVEPHVFLKIMFGNVVPKHVFVLQSAILY
jgi:hypothetical protein